MTRPLFDPEIRQFGTDRRRAQVVRCGSCPAEIVFKVTGGKSAMSPDTIIRKAKDKGWTIGRQGREIECPACDRRGRSLGLARALDTRPEEVRAVLEQDQGGPVTDEVFDRAATLVQVEAVLGEGYPDLKTLRSVLSETPAATALDSIPLKSPPKEPPPMPESKLAPASTREPTRDEKRKVLDRLAELYVSEEIGYSGDWTDDKVAAALSVPRAWVTNLRVEFHGDNAGNENGGKAERERRRAIHELRTDLTKLESRIETALNEWSNSAASMRGRLEKLEGAQ